jgi:hypothetical protein
MVQTTKRKKKHKTSRQKNERFVRGKNDFDLIFVIFLHMQSLGPI